MQTFLTPSFLEKEEMRLLCKDTITSDLSWNAYIETGIHLLNAGEGSAAFMELGGALQIAHKQVCTNPAPTWRWAMRLTESANLLVITLNLLECERLIDPFLHNMHSEIAVLPPLVDCPQGKNKTWLCNWCKSMNCPRRQARLAAMYAHQARRQGQKALH